MSTRRKHLRTLAGSLAYSSMATNAGAANPNVAYGQATLPLSIRSRFLDNINGLKVHMLEAGFETPNRPCILFLHGFPELAYSWRKVMVRLAEAGYHAVAPDQRGFGRTTGWDARYEADLTSFSTLNMIRDALALVSALGYRSVNLVGHDAGSPIAAWCALVRPDVFRSVAMMSAPFGGPPSTPLARPGSITKLDEQLAALPRPRKHYQRYYTTREADTDMRYCPLGLANFFRAYYHANKHKYNNRSPEQRERYNTTRRDRYAIDPEYNARVREQAKVSPEKRREARLRLAFGLSPGQYDALLESQGGGCAICGAGSSDGRVRLSVDHCHETGVVRGILCRGCNQGLGQFADSTDRLARAIEYLCESRNRAVGDMVSPERRAGRAKENTWPAGDIHYRLDERRRKRTPA